ncbi:MAG: ATP-dependent DNA helicase [Lachnospiraceae bacterium]|nr:ATP-dependent DNA helicase [Lachnospiraceae bacterium]
MRNVKISVRSLVEFILREGDIDNRIAHDATTAMQEGGRLHRKIQRAQGGEYTAEVPLSYTYVEKHLISDTISEAFENPKNLDLTTVTVDGRADGIIDADSVTIDEIKGTYRKLERMESPDNVHLAQAKCYAFIYASQNSLEKIGVQMTYVNMDSEEIKRFKYVFSFEELDIWFEELMREYIRWVDMEQDWFEKRNVSIKDTEFPFEYREGQKELVTHVYHTIVHGRKLFLEAPTGVGKTISTIFPTIKAIGEKKAQRMFYLTAKTVTRTVASDTINLLRNKGLRFKSIVITAKDKICPLEERNCNPEACPYAKGHFDRVNDAMFAILTEREDYDRNTLEEYAQRFCVCPFEFSLDVSLFCDAVICDYNYLFDPHVSLKRFFADGKPADSIFLIDEAHNLVDRGRNMYSAVFNKTQTLRIKSLVKGLDPTLTRRLGSVNKELLELKKELDEYVEDKDEERKGRYLIYPDILQLVLSIQRLSDRLIHFLENTDHSKIREELLDFYFDVSHFLYIYELISDGYITYGYYDRDEFCVRLFCVDPSMNLDACMDKGVSSVLFSATLLPIRYYKSLLGGKEEDYEVYARSTFDPSKRGLYLAQGVTTKYTERGRDQYAKIAGYIHEIVEARNGKYMVFFPSYNFLENVKDIYEIMYCSHNETSGDIRLAIQNERMTDEEKEEFLALFSDQEDNCKEQKTLLGFCVLGGAFSEGIDLQGENLIGSIIVGTGIPMVCEENELIKSYFDDRDGEGMKYAYIYPGFNKVLQAAGRVIRTHDDIGIVALLDYRFDYASYRELYPREWSNIKRVNRDSIARELRDFWY